MNELLHFENPLSLEGKTGVLPTTQWGSKVVSYSVWWSITDLQSDPTNRSIGNQTNMSMCNSNTAVKLLLHVARQIFRFDKMSIHLW